MRIITSSLNEGLEHTTNRKDFVREITTRIFSICEESNIFKDKKDRVLRISEKRDRLQEKLIKYNSLLERSNTIKEDLIKKDKELKSYILNVKERLLKMLGSEL